LGIFSSKTATKGEKLSTRYVWGDRHSKNKILLIRVEGVMTTVKPRGAFSALDRSASALDIQNLLDRAEDDKSIKGVLMQFITPGGTVSAAEALAEGISDYGDKAPIFAHVEGISASGGVWAMVAADKIYADPGSIIGSIGVTLGTHAFYRKVIAQKGLLGGIETDASGGGIDFRTLSAGRGKDILNPHRAMTQEEYDGISGMLKRQYADFVNHVSSCRMIDENVITDEMGAMIFDAQTALEYSLIDGIGSRRQAAYAMAEQLGIQDDCQVVMHEEKGKGLIGALFGSKSGSEVAQENSPQLYGTLAMFQPERYT
jgi:protease-4